MAFSPLKWLFIRGAGAAANAAASKLPLRSAPKTRRVRFRDVPIGHRFVNLGAGDTYVRVSHDEACPTEPDWQRHIRYPFNDLDQEVDLCL